MGSAATGDWMLDYGNPPRGTPLIWGEHVIFSGAFGDLLCVQIATGNTVWHLNLRSKFKPDDELRWGYCGSPLLVDDRLIVNPGAAAASLIAVNPDDGSVIWQSPGSASAYGSFIADSFGGKRQIVGHDAKSLGGWDIVTGNRLWTISPPDGGEFNVPTPINVNGRLLISTEQNGTRLYGFNENDEAIAEPVARNVHLTPDMSSPVVVGKLVFCVNKFLYCLDVENELEERCRIRDRALSSYGSIIASEDKLLIIGDGELLLLSANGERSILARQRIFEGNERLYSFPALVGKRLYIRGESRLKCIQLD